MQNGHLVNVGKTNPIQTQYKPNQSQLKPIKCQNKPNTNPNKPNFKGKKMLLSTFLRFYLIFSIFIFTIWLFLEIQNTLHDGWQPQAQLGDGSGRGIRNGFEFDKIPKEVVQRPPGGPADLLAAV